MKPELNIRHITVRRGNKVLLSNINAHIPSHQLTVLMGENGAGKSTLLSALCGEIMIEPQSGNGFWVNEHNYLNQSSMAQARNRALLRQHNNLSLDFEVHEVIALGINRSRQQQDELVRRMAKLTHTEHLLFRVYTTLSGGEQSRVHLARVFAQLWRDEPSSEARILLLDEPVASLDPYHQHHVCQIIHEFIALQQVTVLMTIHDLHLAARYADYAILLHQTKVLAQGTAREVLTPEFLYQAFKISTQISHGNDGRPIIAPDSVKISTERFLF